jgi:predicted RNase H-like nuclease (RuvC/YqgF family)
MTDINTNVADDDLSGLKTKNAELLNKLKASEKQFRDLEARLNDLQEERETALDTTKSDHEKALAKLQRELEKANGEIKSRDERLGTLLIDNAIKDAMTAAKVAPKHMRAVEALLRQGARIENGEAIAADGTPLGDSMAAYFASDEGKEYAGAPENTGAGATGSSAVASKFTKRPETAAEWNEFMNYANTNKEQADALLNSWNAV